MKILSTLILIVAIAVSPVQKDKSKEKEWKSLGEQRITCYCPQCNDGQGYESSSGTELKYGHAACSWLPIGTKINIDGDIFTVVDICGTDAIDIFIDTDSCQCALNEYKEVKIKR